MNKKAIFQSLFAAFLATTTFTAGARTSSQTTDSSFYEAKDCFNRDGSKGVAPFLDRAEAGKREVYQKYASFDDVRGMRLYGELLLQDGDTDEGLEYLTQAAGMKDGRAAFILAQCYGYARNGVECNFRTALQWLETSMANGYAPAFELMAELAWDGSWGVQRSWKQAVAYLDKAIENYDWTLGDTAADGQFQNYVEVLRNTRTKMARLKDGQLAVIADEAKPLKNVTPSFNAMVLSGYSMTDSTDMLHRLNRIQNEMVNYSTTYKLDNFKEVDLGYINVKYIPHISLQGSLGLTTWAADEWSYNVDIKIYPHKSGDYDEKAVTVSGNTVMDSSRLNDTLAHELSHVYFCSRYVAIGGHGTDEMLAVVEGHATNAAYEFTRYTYYNGDLTPEEYATTYLCPKYRVYFNNFRENYLAKDGSVKWDKLDKLEKKCAKNSNYRVHDRRQNKTKKHTSSLTPAFR